MKLSNLLSKAKELASNVDAKEAVKKIANSDAVKKATKKVANNKTVKSATKTVTKAAKSLGIDAKAIMSYAQNNKAVLDVLTKIGLKKDSDPTSSAVQKLVGSLKSAVNKAVGIKLEDKSFGSAVTKILSNTNIKSKLESAAGKGVPAFIKKAVAEYIS